MFRFCGVWDWSQHLMVTVTAFLDKYDIYIYWYIIYNWISYVDKYDITSINEAVPIVLWGLFHHCKMAWDPISQLWIETTMVRSWLDPLDPCLPVIKRLRFRSIRSWLDSNIVNIVSHLRLRYIKTYITGWFWTRANVGIYNSSTMVRIWVYDVAIHTCI